MWPERVVVWPEAVGGLGLAALLQRARGREILWADSEQASALLERERGRSAPGSLHLRRLKGPFLVPCPGTKGHLCCGYHVLRVGENCNLGCSYCVLPHYFRGRGVVAHVNWGPMWEELSVELRARDFTRVGTGEFTDSLSWDHVVGLAPRLVRFFAGNGNALLELKTKSARVLELQMVDARGGTVVSWSLNASPIVDAVEKGTASLEERLRAASRVAGWGYGVGFHFDPLVWYPGWQEGYREAVELLFRHVSPRSVVWISLGALRFPRSMRSRLRSSEARALVAHGEWVQGLDGKDRYYRPLRVELYSALSSAIRSMAGEGVPVYLCMESPAVWRESLGWAPSGSHEVAALLDRAGMKWRHGKQ